MKRIRKLFKELFANSKELFVNSFFYCLAIGLAEEVLEYIIAFQITNWLAHVASIFIASSIGAIGKRVIAQFVRQVTYKEGNDKVNKLKEIFQTLFRNKCTILGAVDGGLAFAAGTGVLNLDAFPPIVVGSVNLTPWLFWGVVGVASMVFAFFPETKAQYEARQAQKTADKTTKAIDKEAKAKKKLQDKQAKQSQINEEKARAKEAKLRAEEEKKTKLQEEEDRAKAEHDALVDARIAELREEQLKKLK